MQNGETQIGFLEGYAVKGLFNIKTQKTMALIELLDHNKVVSTGVGWGSNFII